MDHVVYLDAKANELDNILKGNKTMIIRGASGRKLPYGRVNIGDILFFINNNGEGLIRAKASVKSVYNSEKMIEEESIKLVNDNQKKLKLTDQQLKRWAGKKYLVLIEIENYKEIINFKIDKTT